MYKLNFSEIKACAEKTNNVFPCIPSSGLGIKKNGYAVFNNLSEETIVVIKRISGNGKTKVSIDGFIKTFDIINSEFIFCYKNCSIIIERLDGAIGDISVNIYTYLAEDNGEKQVLNSLRKCNYKGISLVDKDLIANSGSFIEGDIKEIATEPENCFSSDGNKYTFPVKCKIIKLKCDMDLFPKKDIINVLETDLNKQEEPKPIEPVVVIEKPVKKIYNEDVEIFNSNIHGFNGVVRNFGAFRLLKNNRNSILSVSSTSEASIPVASSECYRVDIVHRTNVRNNLHIDIGFAGSVVKTHTIISHTAVKNESIHFNCSGMNINRFFINTYKKIDGINIYSLRIFKVDKEKYIDSIMAAQAAIKPVIQQPNNISIPAKTEQIYTNHQTNSSIARGKIKVSVVISLKNRTKFLRHTMQTYINQTMPKQDFELIFVDDGSTENLLEFLKPYSKYLNIKYLRIDNSKSDIPIWSHTPALSNNVGFKNASGEVIVICGPEILHKETNLDECYNQAMTGISAFGLVWHSNLNFVNTLFKDDNYIGKPFNVLANIPGAKHNCITQNTFYWYILAVKKSNIFAINGVDEEYGRGVCAEDDDFAARLNLSKCYNKNIHSIVGIHMEHNSGDDQYDARRRRNTQDWIKARQINTQRWNNWNKHPKPTANENRVWGSQSVVTQDVFMQAGIVCDHKAYSTSTVYDYSKLKVFYLPLGDQCGMIDAFNSFKVQLKTLDLLNYNQSPNVFMNSFNSTIRDFSPDLLHMQLQYTGYIQPNVLANIKATHPNIIISNWTGDIMQSVPKYFTDVARVIDYSLISSTGQINECNRASGRNNTYYWQVGMLEKFTRPLRKTQFKYYISFLGNVWNQFPGSKTRNDFAVALKTKYGPSFGLFGQGWAIPNNGFMNARLGCDLVYNDSLCVLNVSNFNDVSDYFSDRFTACLSSGRPVISMYFPNIEKYIEHGVDGFIVKTPSECIDIVEYLRANPDKASEIGERGARRILETGSFTHKVFELFKLTGIYDRMKVING